MLDWPAIRQQARQGVHDTFAAPVLYTAPGGVVTPSAEQTTAGLLLTARWSNKLAIGGNGDIGEYASVLEGIDRLVFNQPQLTALGLVLRKSAKVTFPAYGKTFVLDTPLPVNGPVHRYWLVVADAAG